MTEETNAEKRSKILGMLRTSDENEIIARARADPNAGASANRKVHERGLDYLLNVSFNGGAPRYTEASFGALTPADQEAKREEGFAFGTHFFYEHGVQDLKSKFKEVISDDEGNIYSNLAKIIDGQFMSIPGIPEKHQGVIGAYASLSEWSRLMKKTSEGKQLTPKEEEAVQPAISEGKRVSAESYYGGRKYSDNLVKLAGRLAMLANSERPSSKEITAGIGEVLKRQIKAVTSKYGEDFESKAARGAADTIKELISSGNPEKTKLGASKLYEAFTGYGIGERDYKAL